jgi:diguanylate cyclase (GGDEF)-like protein
MYDIDHFKNINDTYGHPCGDYILKEISNAALQTFRKTDTVFRFGGEEFVVILPETDITQAQIPLERFRKTVETLNLNYQNQQITVTVSIGACQYCDEMSSKEELLGKTDEALYKAKNSGRNKTVLY